MTNIPFINGVQSGWDQYKSWTPAGSSASGLKQGARSLGGTLADGAKAIKHGVAALVTGDQRHQEAASEHAERALSHAHAVGTASQTPRQSLAKLIMQGPPEGRADEWLRLNRLGYVVGAEAHRRWIHASDWKPEKKIRNAAFSALWAVAYLAAQRLHKKTTNLTMWGVFAIGYAASDNAITEELPQDVREHAKRAFDQVTKVRKAVNSHIGCVAAAGGVMLLLSLAKRSPLSQVASLGVGVLAGHYLGKELPK